MISIEKLLDDTGLRILQELQQNARISYSELGKRNNMSSPSVAERIAKMEEAGIISGYRAQINLSKVGLNTLAIIHLTSVGGSNCNQVFTEVCKIPGVLECYRLTGDDSVIVKVATSNADELAVIIDQLSQQGIPSTSLLRSEFMKGIVTLTRESL